MPRLVGERLSNLMSSQQPFILVIGHSARRSGAPVLLLELLKQISETTDLQFRIVLRQGGELLTEYRKLAPTFLWSPEPDWLPLRGKRITSIATTAREANRLKRFARGASLVFNNTITNGSLLAKLSFLNCPVITYVHELQSAIAQATTPADFREVLSRTNFFLVVSAAVGENLVSSHQVDRQKISISHPAVPLVEREQRWRNVLRTAFREQQAISPDAVVIGVVGSAELRKGIDLLVPLARLYTTMFPADDVHFVWLGVDRHSNAWRSLAGDETEIAIADRVYWLEHRAKPEEVMASFDIHLLLSREDPYPLVMLEAGLLEIPTVCFAGAGGGEEFVREGGGVSVEFGNLLSMANALHELACDPAQRSDMGARAKRTVLSGHTVPLAAEALSKILSTSTAGNYPSQMTRIHD